MIRHSICKFQKRYTTYRGVQRVEKCGSSVDVCACACIILINIPHTQRSSIAVKFICIFAARCKLYIYNMYAIMSDIVCGAA